MELATVYKYNDKGVYIGTVQTNILNGVINCPPRTTTIAPPAYKEHEEIPVFEDGAWKIVEDHRQYLDETGTYVGGTKYWLPEDDYQSEGHYTKEVGPLPAGALFERPAKPADVVQKEQLQQTIGESKQILSSTDYRILKFMDKYISEHPEIKTEFDAEYPTTLAERAEARETINSAEASAQVAGINL